MTIYPDVNNIPELLKIRTRNDEIEISKNQTEKQGSENWLKSLKSDNNFYRRKNESLNKMKVSLIITEILIGTGLVVAWSTMAVIILGVGIVISSNTSLLTSIANSFTNEYISKVKKIRYTKLRDWINVVTLLQEKILKESMVDKKIDAK